MKHERGTSLAISRLLFRFAIPLRPRTLIESLSKIYIMDNLLNANVAIPHYSPLLSPLPTPHAPHWKSELSGLTWDIRTPKKASNIASDKSLLVLVPFIGLIRIAILAQFIYKHVSN